MNLFICYPKCSTCKTAQKWLDEHHIPYEYRDIKLNCPTEAELKQWLEMSGLDIKKFFNTSGLSYKALNLKDQLDNLSLDEKIKLLSSDGMLVKRPLFIGNNIVVGFKPEVYEKEIV